MNVFVTGATGFVGQKLTMKLAQEGHTVHALYRDLSKTKALSHQNIKLFKGDILEKESLLAAMKECKAVFHTAAFIAVWVKDTSEIESVNLRGTENVLKAALELSVEKVVCTSTAGVFGSSGEKITDETQNYPLTFYNRYEETKAEIEQTVIPQFINKGLNIVVVNPTRIYGPGPLSDANSLLKIIKFQLEGKVCMIPSDGKSIGNYTYIDDVVDGHILAMKNGRSGERYLLGGENIAYIDLIRLVDRVSGKRSRMIMIPVSLMFLFSWISIMSARITGRKPLITPGFVRKFLPDWRVSSEKAKKELKYNPVRLEVGIKQTVDWLKKEYNL
jgi:farnesol dehydrogenase